MGAPLRFGRLAMEHSRSPSKPWRRWGAVGSAPSSLAHAASFRPDDHDELSAKPAILEKPSQLACAKAISDVYNNDLLMRHIVSFVTDFNDRIHVEMSSARLRHISRTAKWRFKSGGDSLTLSFRTLNSYVTVELGDVWFVLPCTTMDNRRQGSRQLTTQPRKLMNTLYGMAERFALGIKRVAFGGVEMWSSSAVQNHQLIVTVDLLRFINDRLRNVASISFSNCGFDEHAVEYLSSEQCSFPIRLQELSLSGVWFDSDTFVSKFVSTVTPSLSSLLLEDFKAAQLGFAVLQQLQEKTVLTDLLIRVTPYSFQGMTVPAIRNFFSTASAVTRELRIHVRCSRRSRAGALLFAIRNLPAFDSISELQFLIQPGSQQEAEDAAYLLDNLGKFPRLQKLKCGGWRNYDLTSALCNGLAACFALQDLSLSNIDESSQNETAMLLSFIPSHLLSLEFKSLAVTDLDFVDLSTRLDCLTSLRLSKLLRLSARGIYQSTSNLRRLEVLYCSIPINTMVLRHLLNRSTYPKLRKMTVVMNTGTPRQYNDMLSQHFASVHCSTHYSNQRWCYIEADRRHIR
ncbi:hypothetical protein Q1695_002721 [Nippostrongylus brasiliensis]|nr:hypothetical protein Q1695_002721 [Nippostrongylus brasiliensis]